LKQTATIGEGNTPLVESVSIGRDLGLRLLFKLEMCNPSGSYKDRFIAAQITQFLASGVTACVATSSGNTGAALAAFCARYGIACAILVNEFAPLGKLQQMQAHGARVLRVKEFITSARVTDGVYRRLRQMSVEDGIPLVVSAYSYCPEGMQGVESIAAELSAQCEAADHVFVPVGGGGLFTAVCRGFEKCGAPRPKIHAVQPDGCATVVSAFNSGGGEIPSITSTTRVSGLSVPFDIDASLALRELRQSGGFGIAIPDEEIFSAQKRLLREEGIWCEPAGAAALAGCLYAKKRAWIATGETVICLVTGHGFKDSDSLTTVLREHPVELIDENEISSQLFEVKV
jgi:threonine synthase